MTQLPRNQRDFILANTSISSPPQVPEIKLYLADEAHNLWSKTEEELNQIDLPPPFWAFAWAGGQGLARYILDNPSLVANKSVLDFASGSGLVAIAAKSSGAVKVVANDIDPFCNAAIGLNAELNEQHIIPSNDNMLATAINNLNDIDVILAGDIFYDKQMVNDLWPFLQAAASSGATVIVGDPGRTYIPEQGLDLLATYNVPVSRILEDSDVKLTSIWKVK